MAKNGVINLDDSGPESLPHDLFPTDTGEPPQISYITVTRWEAGAKVTCPYLFGSDELKDAMTLQSMFGGGKYELVARDGRKRLSARSTLTLSGKPKPLIYPVEEEPIEEAPLADVSQVAASAPGLGNLGAILGAVAPLVIQFIQSQQAAQSQQQQQTMMLFQAIMNQSQQASREHVSSMQAMYQSQTQQFAELLKSRPSSGGESSFQDGIAFMTEFLESQRQQLQDAQGAGASDDGMKTLETMLNGLQVLQSLGGQGTPPVTPPAAIPGSNGVSS
jgi:hypothetical protein